MVWNRLRQESMATPPHRLAAARMPNLSIGQQLLVPLPAEDLRRRSGHVDVVVILIPDDAEIAAG